MNRIEIPYLNRTRLILMMLTVLVPMIVIVRLSVMVISSMLAYWIFDIIVFVVLVAIWYRLAFRMPGVRNTAYTWAENGVTYLQMNKDAQPAALDQVEEIFLSVPSTVERIWGNKNIMLEIKNAGVKHILLSLPMDKLTDIEDTVFHALFMHLKEKNPQLTPEKDIKGEEIPYWYSLKNTGEDKEKTNG